MVESGTVVTRVSSPEVRFQFGANWLRFLSTVNEQRISAAAEKLSDWLGDIRGKCFLDIGCGSGIHSLAAIRLGVSRVVSFDYDPQSVGCTEEMRRRFAPESDWRIEQGSALDEGYLRSLGRFDIVYSWGVLHHTGDMWKALDLATIPANDVLMLALYNDQGIWSKVWHKIKSTYNKLPSALRPAFVLAVMGPSEFKYFAHVGPFGYIHNWKSYRQQRGMSRWHDLVDWCGGYPFEVSKPEQVFRFYRDRGFTLTDMSTCAGGLGCNVFTFKRL